MMYAMGNNSEKRAENKIDLNAMRHSLAHIMASAVLKLWPGAKLGVGPVVENGFYYDIDLGDKKISEEDFKSIEKEMKSIIRENQEFERSEQSIDAGIAWAKKARQPYKEELLNDLKRDGTTLARELDSSMMGLPAGISGVTSAKAEVGKVSFYKNGDFIDLCRGPHLESTGQAGAFKLMRVAGAYWRGDEKNPQMQRLYGVAFESEKELKAYLELLEEAKKRDHRKLGQELDLFSFSELVGSGLPLFSPRGTVLRNELVKFTEELREGLGYQRVWIPHITKKDLYQASGHWTKFGDELFLVKSQETSDELVIKPMNCPHHTQIYASRQRSYRDLPVRYMETTTIYRDEKSGELHGLSRVRSVTQDDCHVFCTLDQFEDEAGKLIDAAGQMYKILGLDLSLRLSYRDDTDNYLGEKDQWQKAQASIEKLAKDKGLDYFTVEGEAAFYGPKIDFMAKDALNRTWQVATVQLDFVQPARFGLEYSAEDGTRQTPIMIHSALLGSVERFLSVYIEHTAGKFPVWLAPEQLRIITVNQEEETVRFAESILQKSKELGLRAVLDNDNESVGKKIRQAEIQKIPYAIVIGDKEISSGEVVPRVRSDMEVQKEHASHKVVDFLGTIKNEAATRVSKSSL